MKPPRWLVKASPHVASPESTPRIMWSVVATLVPIVLASFYFFGPSALLVIGAATLGAVLVEAWFGKKRSLFDGSAVITGVLLGLTLPPGMPMWMAFVGGGFGIAFGKLVFGGLGQNPFNPALIGRAFLQAAFPVAITTWPQNAVGNPVFSHFGFDRLASWAALRGDNFALPLMSPHVLDGTTSATPLGLMKFQHVSSDLSTLLLGSTGGSLGETSALLILLGGLYLALRNHLNWRIPVSILATVFVFSGLLHVAAPDQFAAPWFMLFSGGLMLGAWYMATDMVTSPVTNKGCLVFGVGIGALVVIIRTWGGLPEGVQYSILLMNALVPFINRATQPRVFGTQKARASS
ncbi:MAG: RnfABCDGE type electron transport complex subunit D [Planctomycetota bacterium]